MNCFSGITDHQTAANVFPERTVTRKPQHRDFPISRGGNQFRIADIEIRSVTTTSRRHKYIDGNTADPTNLSQTKIQVLFSKSNEDDG